MRAIDKALELIGEWKAAFGNRSGYKAVHDMFGELEREGFFIPEPQVASASFIKQPPEWVMGDRCHMCRQEFNRLKGWFPVSAILCLKCSIIVLSVMVLSKARAHSGHCVCG